MERDPKEVADELAAFQREVTGKLYAAGRLTLEQYNSIMDVIGEEYDSFVARFCND